MFDYPVISGNGTGQEVIRMTAVFAQLGPAMQCDQIALATLESGIKSGHEYRVPRGFAIKSIENIVFVQCQPQPH